LIVFDLALTFLAWIIRTSDTVPVVAQMITQMNRWNRADRLVEDIAIAWVINLMHDNIQS
jgi:hypothetical protein